MNTFDHVPGWSHPDEYRALVRYASECPGPWVEIGSYCGRSACCLGVAAKEAGEVVFAVDPHRGNPEMSPGEACHHPEVWAREHGSLSALVDNIRANDLEGAVVPVVGSGDAFALTCVRPGFVFIDGFHDYPAVLSDFMTWSHLLAPGGVICLHDADATGPELVKLQAVAAGWELVEQVKSLAVLRRP